MIQLWRAGRVRMFLAALAVAVSVNAEPEFVGVLVSRGTAHVAVRANANEPARWIGIGEQWGEYRITGYDAAKETLRLKRGDVAIELTLKQAAVKLAPTLALLESLVREGDIELKKSMEHLRLLDARLKTTAAELAALESRPHSEENAGTLVEVRRKFRLEEANVDYYLQNLLNVAQKRVAK